MAEFSTQIEKRFWLYSFLETLSKNPFPNSFKWWPNSVTYGCRIAVVGQALAISFGYSQGWPSGLRITHIHCQGPSKSTCPEMMNLCRIIKKFIHYCYKIRIGSFYYCFLWMWKVRRLPGTSLVVQCVSLWTSNAGRVGSIHGQGTKILCTTQLDQKRYGDIPWGRGSAGL